jgi:RNA polymerase sigma-70 factor (ECF subfamily)
LVVSWQSARGHAPRVPDAPPSPAERDRRWIEAIRRGDEHAFEELYREHRDWVFRLALRLTGKHADALDVLQESFAYLLRRLPGLELRVGLRTFLYPAVQHLSAAARQKAGRAHSDEEALESAPAPDSPPEGGHLAAALRRLPDPQREVLLLRFVDGLLLEEIAAALGIPLGTVKSRMHHALAALRADEGTRSYFEEA